MKFTKDGPPTAPLQPTVEDEGVLTAEGHGCLNHTARFESDFITLYFCDCRQVTYKSLGSSAKIGCINPTPKVIERMKQKVPALPQESAMGEGVSIYAQATPHSQTRCGPAESGVLANQLDRKKQT